MCITTQYGPYVDSIAEIWKYVYTLTVLGFQSSRMRISQRKKDMKKHVMLLILIFLYDDSIAFSGHISYPSESVWSLTLGRGSRPNKHGSHITFQPCMRQVCILASQVHGKGPRVPEESARWVDGISKLWQRLGKVHQRLWRVEECTESILPQNCENEITGPMILWPSAKM